MTSNIERFSYSFSTPNANASYSSSVASMIFFDNMLLFDKLNNSLIRSFPSFPNTNVSYTSASKERELRLSLQAESVKSNANLMEEEPFFLSPRAKILPNGFIVMSPSLG